MLDENEEQELSALVDELQLSDFERRRRRMRAAEQRLKALRELQGETGGGLAEALAKDRNGEPLSDDEFIVTHLGFTKAEWELQRSGVIHTIRFGNGQPLSESERRHITHTIRFGDGTHDVEPDKPASR